MNGEQPRKYRGLAKRKKEDYLYFYGSKIQVESKECISVKFHLLVLGFKKYLLRVLDK